MADLQNLLDQIDRLEPELATAPWFVANANEDTEYMPFWQVMNHAYLNDPGTEDDVSCDVEMYVGSKADAEFIALARTALPKLASVIRRLRECAQTLTEDNNDASDYASGIHEAVECFEHIITDVFEDAADRQALDQARAEDDGTRITLDEYLEARDA